MIDSQDIGGLALRVIRAEPHDRKRAGWISMPSAAAKSPHSHAGLIALQCPHMPLTERQSHSHASAALRPHA